MEDREQQQSFSLQPFDDTVDPTFFFSGGTRQEVIDEIRHALITGISLITLVGPEGSGKTMICRMVERELPTNLLCVFLPQAVESFNDMVEIVGREVLARPELSPDATTEELLNTIADSLDSRNLRLLIVFEEAEKIYLATLERIRKMLDKVNEQKNLLHILLSGRPLLSDSLEQLSIVAFREIEECNLVLEDLDEEATAAYLRYGMSVRDNGPEEVLPADIVAGIYAASAGNFRKINQLARDYLHAEQTDTPFLLLLDSIKQSERQEGNKRVFRSRAGNAMPKVDLEFLAWPKFRPVWLAYSGGVVLILVMLALFWGRPPEQLKPPDAEEVPSIVLQPVPMTGEPKPTTDGEKGRVVDGLAGSESGKKPAAVAGSSTKTAGEEALPKDQTAGRPDKGAMRQPAEEEKASVQETVSQQPAAVSPPVATDARQAELARQESGGNEAGNTAAEHRPEPAAKPVAIGPDGPENNEAGNRQPAAEEETQRSQAAASSTVTSPVSSAAELDASPAVEQVIVRRVEDSEAKPAEVVPEPVKIVGEKKKRIITPTEPDVKKPPEPVHVAAAESKKVAVAESPEIPVAVPVDVPEVEPVTVVLPESPQESPQPVVKPGVAEPVKVSPEASAPITSSLPPRVSVPEPAVPPQSPAPPAPVAGVSGNDSLYQERLAAGARWLVGGGSGKFTVQLMVLTSEQAEDNLKQIFEDKDYRAIADELFVLRRLGSPSTVMLYYGEYRTLAAAQKARNTLPVFLRKHDPYPISIHAAVEKTKSLQ